MEKIDSSMDVVGSYATREALRDGPPAAKANGDRDEDDLAVFGKRPQLKVRSPSPWIWALKIHDSENSASFPWLV